MKKIIISALLTCLMAIVGTAWGDWRYMPGDLPRTIGACTRVVGPLWPMTYVPNNTWLYLACYTTRPTEKKDIHIEAWNGTFYSFKMRYEYEDGSQQIFEIGRATRYTFEYYFQYYMEDVCNPGGY